MPTLAQQRYAPQQTGKLQTVPQSLPTPEPAASTGLDTQALGSLQGVQGGLQQQQQQNQQHTSGLRDILMSQLGMLSQPVSQNDPGISPVLQAQRLESQRTAERQRSSLAERAASQGLSSSGALDTGILGIQQQQGERNVGAIGQVLGGEMQARRQSLQGLLNQALALGDQQAAQNIQQQLGAIGTQLQQSNTYDEQGYRLAALQALLNGQSVDSILGAL